MSKNKRLIKVFIGIFLFLIGALLFFRHLFYADFSFTVLSYTHPLSSFRTNVGGELLAGRKVSGVIEAKENYLGIIAVRFNTFDRKNEDYLLFQIRPEESREWYSQTRYRTTFENHAFYNFGFPPIADSGRKKYYFEIVSTAGKPGNTIAIDTKEPIILTKYKFPKSVLMHNRQMLINFIFKKIAFLLDDKRLYVPSVIFFLPFIQYLIWNKTKRVQKRFILLVGILVALYSIIDPAVHDDIVLVLAIIWIAFIIRNRWKADLSIKSAIVIIGSSAIPLYFSLFTRADKLLVFAFIPLCIGTAQQVLKNSTIRT